MFGLFVSDGAHHRAVCVHLARLGDGVGIYHQIDGAVNGEI